MSTYETNECLCCVLTLAERTSSERGYYTDRCFEEYVDFLLDPGRGGIPDDGRWRILVVDGYGSHTCVPSVLRKFQQRRIFMITMPSHTSHVLQPLDVSCFKPTKYYFSWCLRTIFKGRSVQAVQKTEAPSYFELALSEGCCASTIQNGFRATGLFPFNKEFVAQNKQMFQMADTLDADKMKEKMFAKNGSITVCESYRALKSTTTKLVSELEKSREVLQQQFPDLCATLDQVVLNSQNLELPMKEAAAIFHIPDSTKVHKPVPPRTNFIGETFHESRVLNREARIERIEQRLEEVAIEKRAKAEKAAQKQANSKAKSEATQQRKLDREEEERPVLQWLKEQGYAPEEVKVIGKAHITAAFEAHRQEICELVRNGGDRISKSTSIKQMVHLFKKYDVLTLHL